MFTLEPGEEGEGKEPGPGVVEGPSNLAKDNSKPSKPSKKGTSPVSPIEGAREVEEGGERVAAREESLKLRKGSSSGGAGCLGCLCFFFFLTFLSRASFLSVGR